MNAARLIRKCFHERYLSILLPLLSVAVLAMATATQAFEAKLSNDRREVYGYHNLLISSVTQKEAAAITAHYAITSCGVMTVSGDIVDEDENVLGSIGTVDQNLIAMEHWSLLAGDWPQSERDIVLETLMLDKLHLSYDLGQEIQLTVVLEDHSQRQGTWRLCGILGSYTPNWDSGGVCLPSAIVYKNVSSSMQTNLLIQARYKDAAEAEELLPLLTGEFSTLLWNDMSWPERTSSAQDLILRGTAVIITILASLLLIVCLQLLQQPRIAHSAAILKMLGLENRTLLSLLLHDSMRLWLASCLWSASTALLLAVGLWLAGLPPTVTGVLAAMLAGMGTAALSLLILRGMEIVGIFRRQAPPKGRGMEAVSPRVRRRKRSVTLTLNAFLKLELRGRRKPLLIQASLVFLAAAVVSLCLYGIGDSLQSQSLHDRIAGYDYRWESSHPESGLTESQVLTIAAVDEITEVVAAAEAAMVHRAPFMLAWDGSVEDPYRAAGNLINHNEDDGEHLMVSIVAVPEHSPLWSHYQIKGFDRGTFLNGSGVIAYFPVLETGEDGGCFVLGNYAGNQAEDSEYTVRSSLRTGDSLTLTAGEQEFSLSCAGVMAGFLDSSQTSYDFLTPCTLIVSETLYRQLCCLPEMLYNRVMAWGSHLMTYEAGDVLMSRIAVGGSVDFINRRADNEARSRQTLLSILSLTVIAVMIGAVTAVLLRRHTQAMRSSTWQRDVLLQRLGAEPDLLRKLSNNRMLWLTVPLLMVFDLALAVVMNHGILALYLPLGFIRAVLLTATYFSSYYPWKLWLAGQIAYLIILWGQCKRKQRFTIFLH